MAFTTGAIWLKEDGGWVLLCYQCVLVYIYIAPGRKGPCRVLLTIHYFLLQQADQKNNKEKNENDRIEGEL